MEVIKGRKRVRGYRNILALLRPECREEAEDDVVAPVVVLNLTVHRLARSKLARHLAGPPPNCLAKSARTARSYASKLVGWAEIREGLLSGTGSDALRLIQAAHDLGPTIVGMRDEIERQRRLPDPLVDRLRDLGFFSLLLAHVYGGPE